MQLVRRKTLAIIGAGPKGLAVAVKAKVLAEFGLPVARVTLIERHQIAAHWSGEFGYTNGDLLLGTSPEKDVVFPIDPTAYDASLRDAIQKRLLDFTWMSYLIAHDEYSDWIDRGRPAPCHKIWASYLLWVFEHIKDQVTCIGAEVLSADQDDHKWNITIQSKHSSQPETLVFDQLMMTGPGQVNAAFLSTQELKHPPVYDLEAFWAALKTGSFDSSGKIAIVGAGENAASILLALSKYAPDAEIEVITPRGFIATRAENYYENQFYSQPERSGWSDLNTVDRQDFMARTDLGVFSVHAMTLLNEKRRHRVIPGRVVTLNRQDHGALLSIDYGGQVSLRPYRSVIIASGFDQILTMRKLLSNRTIDRIETAIGDHLTHETLSQHIDASLAVANFKPNLYLPMLAGLKQGPGFANLSCLGSLSDRVLMRGLSGEAALSDDSTASTPIAKEA